MEKIVMSDTHSISMMTAVHLSSSSTQASQSTTKKLTKQRAEELIDEWSIAGYFMTINEAITLGPKGVGEFRDTFRTKFPDYIQSCQLCNEIALQVQSIGLKKKSRSEHTRKYVIFLCLHLITSTKKLLSLFTFQIFLTISLLQPQFCPNDQCETSLDKRCYKNYVLKKKKCPGCKCDWIDDEQ